MGYNFEFNRIRLNEEKMQIRNHEKTLSELSDVVELVKEPISESKLKELGLEPTSMIDADDPLRIVTMDSYRSVAKGLDGALMQLLVDTVNMQCYYFDIKDVDKLMELLGGYKYGYMQGYSDGFKNGSQSTSEDIDMKDI